MTDTVPTSNQQAFDLLLDNYRAVLHKADVAPCAPNQVIALQRRDRIDTARLAITQVFDSLTTRLTQAEKVNGNLRAHLELERSANSELRKMVNGRDRTISEDNAEIERLRAALKNIVDYDPGQFRPLKDEIAIWRLATEALGPVSGDSSAPDKPPAHAATYLDELINNLWGWQESALDDEPKKDRAKRDMAEAAQKLEELRGDGKPGRYWYCPDCGKPHPLPRCNQSHSPVETTTSPDLTAELRDLIFEQKQNCSCPYGDCSTCTRAEAFLARSSPVETPVTLSPDGAQLGRWKPLDIHADDAEKATEDRQPTGQCSWGCYYASNGRFVRDSACTVHGASSENGKGDV